MITVERANKTTTIEIEEKGYHRTNAWSEVDGRGKRGKKSTEDENKRGESLTREIDT